MLIGLRRARVARVVVAVLACALVCVSLLPSASAFLRLRSQEEIDDIRASTAASRAAARKAGGGASPVAAAAAARVRYQSPNSGNSEFNNSAIPTTIAEFDDNLADWINDRPHTELFFLPSQCDSGTRKCCMSYNDEVCGGSLRGSCLNVVENDTVCKQTDGFYWFSDYFDYSCVCNGNYWGPACGECRTGWEGDDCNTRSKLLVRRDFASLSTIDKQYVIDAFRLAKLTPSPYQPNVSVFDFWAVIHHWSLPGGAFVNTTARPSLVDVSEGHVGSGAIPYHRALVAGIEHGLQYALGNYSFALPYWNWTFSQGNDNDETLLWFGGDGDTNDMGTGVESFCRQPPPNSAWMGECDCRMNRGPFALWPLVGDWGYVLNDTIERAFGCHSLWAPSLPFQPAVDCAIADSQFDMPTGDTVLVTARYNVSEDDLALWTTGAVFHNLLGGGFLCGTYWTWPMAMKETDLHERTHRWLSGTLLGHHPASDPLFWMLHGYADTIYEQWLRNTNSLRGLSTDNSWSDWNGPLGHTRNECQGPMYPLQQQWHCFNDSRVLGFTYDVFNDNPDTPTSMPSYSGSRWQHVYPAVTDPLSVFEVDEVALVADASVDAPSSVLMFTPSECDADARICCPATDDGLTCGGSARGSCLDIFDSGECSSLQSDSLWWLTMNFDKVCVCEGNFAGVDCGSCAAGWTGDNCTEAATVRVRRDFSTLSTSDRQYVVDAINLARVASSAYQPALSVLQYFAATVFWVQTGNSKPSSTESTSFIHNMDGAVLWQRTLLQRFEAELARITSNESFSLPYWNWATSMGNDNDAVLRYFGGDGATNSSSHSDINIYCRIGDRSGYGGCNCSVSRVPFLNLRVVGDFGADLGVVQRAFACQGAVAASLPSVAAVEYTVTIPTFFNDTEENFAKTMTGTMYDDAVHTWPPGEEGDMLSRVQNWVSGTMTTPGLAAHRSLASSPGSDPMYWMALGYSDLLLERWMRTAEQEGWTMLESLPIEGAQTGMNRDECMVAMFPLTTNAAAFTSSLNVGYTYDFFDTVESA